MSDVSVGDTVQVTLEGTVISTTQGSFVAISFRDAYANEHIIWFSGMNKIERLEENHGRLHNQDTDSNV